MIATKKHAPEKLSDLQGNPSSHQQLKDIMADPRGRALVSGDPGVGKTSAVYAIANEIGCKIIEINADPHRLDLDWRYLKYAKEKGVLLSINPDAHKVQGLHNIRFGVGIARKGWLESQDVFNTMPLKNMKEYLDSMYSAKQLDRRRT